MSHLSSDLKLIFSGHETFALRQLWLRKAYTQVLLFQDEKTHVCSKTVFSSPDAVERFGVGKNMVASIKHWALATDIIRESTEHNGFEIGEVGELLFNDSNGLDIYLEEESTVWLIHWLLAGKSIRSTTWYILFNFLNSQAFDQKEVLSLIEQLVSETEIVRSKKTLISDIDTCLKSYISDINTEDGIEPLLSSLGLIETTNKGSYQFHYGYHESLSDQIFCYALLDFWEKMESKLSSSHTTLSFKNIAYDYGSPGRVFKLSEYGIGERLSRIAEISNGYLEWVDSSGLKQISRVKNEPINTIKNDLLRSAYV